MTAGGVIPLPEDRCALCRGTGWVTTVGHDGDGYDTTCPNGCPTGPHIADAIASDEVPF